MILGRREYFGRDHYEAHAGLAPPHLAELVVHCLELVAALASRELPFRFKGGNSLLLILQSLERFSIDVDISTGEPRERIRGDHGGWEAGQPARRDSHAAIARAGPGWGASCERVKVPVHPGYEPGARRGGGPGLPGPWKRPGRPEYARPSRVRAGVGHAVEVDRPRALRGAGKGRPDMLLELMSPYMSVAVVGAFWLVAIRRPTAIARPARRPPVR